jgi:acetyl esterase/lipase
VGLRRLLLLSLLASLATACPSLGTLFRDRGGVEFDGDVAYLDDGDPAHTLDLYAPADAEAGAEDGPVVVVFVHGGYWNGQDKRFWEWFSGLYGNVGVALAREGFIVANIDYRLFPEVELPGMLDDVDAAVAFMGDRFPGSPVVLMGHSAGAHLASAAALLPEASGGPGADVDGLVLVSGVYDIANAVAVDSADNRERILEPLFGDSADE